MARHTIVRLEEDVEEQLNVKIRDNHFALQMDEATASNKDGLLIIYVRFTDADELREDLLFCKLIEPQQMNCSKSLTLT